MRIGSALKRTRYYGSVTLIYGLTLLFACLMFNPGLVRGQPPAAAVSLAAASGELSPGPSPQAPVIISGRPVRIVIPGLGIDVPIQPGYYDAADDSWTLSDTEAQFATLSAPANNYSGSTFIYGHRLPNIFGSLWHIQAGAAAKVYTSNGHIFSYKFIAGSLVSPKDTAVLAYQGPPILTVQTCGGSWDSQRHMFIFKFQEVIR